MHTFASLYSGCGGLDLGLAKAGFAPVWANEIDEHAVETYNRISLVRDRQWAAPASLFTGHRAFPGDVEIAWRYLPPEGSVTLLAGGPPCQGFSRAGKMDPRDPRSRHVYRFMDAVDKVRPRAFIMENVPHLATSPRWKPVFEELRRRAGRIGYQVHLMILNAADYGVAQHRERMFLVGLPPSATFREPFPLGWRITAYDVLAAVPPLGETGNTHPCTARVTLARKPVLRASPYAGMLFNGQGRLINLNAPAPTLPATMGGNRTPVIDLGQLARNVPPWLVEYHSMLMAGGEPLAGLPPEAEMRRLSVEEAAALQSFPWDMPFQGPLTAMFRQVGNAVPPMLAWYVGQAVRTALG